VIVFQQADCTERRLDPAQPVRQVEGEEHRTGAHHARDLRERAGFVTARFPYMLEHPDTADAVEARGGKGDRPGIGLAARDEGEAVVAGHHTRHGFERVPRDSRAELPEQHAEVAVAASPIEHSASRDDVAHRDVVWNTILRMRREVLELGDRSGDAGAMRLRVDGANQSECARHVLGMRKCVPLQRLVGVALPRRNESSVSAECQAVRDGSTTASPQAAA
jgi:hypothetical protein